VSLWKYIRRGWDAFSSFVRIAVADVHDVWCGDHSLKESFSELFCIVRDRDAMVGDHTFAHNGEVH
jgi:hypothetical protein